MKAVVLGEDRDIHVREVPQPTAGPGEVLLKVDYCGICGTDLHAPQLDIFRVGVTLGHEFAGEIVDVGPGVTGWKVGDRVCVNPNGDVCGQCAFCRAGQFHLCPHLWETVIGLVKNGGMAPYAAVKAVTLHRLPPGVSSKQGAWVEPLAVAVRMVRNSEIKLGEPAIVFGAGPIGLLAIKALRANGAGQITVVEPSPFRGEMAGRSGADVVVNPFKEDLAERFPDPATAPAYAFECAGVASAVEAALRVLRPHGRLTVVGIATQNPFFRPADLIFKEIDIRGSFIYLEEFDLAIDLLNRGTIEVESLITDVRPVEDGPAAFAAMRQPEKAIKIVLKGH